MGQVQTGTICPFPFTFNKTTINKIKNGEIKQNDLNVHDDCLMNYAEYLSIEYQALQYTMMVVSLLLLFLFCYRIYKLSTYAKSIAKRRMIDLPQFRFFIIGATGSLLIFIESIDLLSFSNRFPKEIYFLCDEILTIVIYALVHFLVDFWAMLALAVRVGSVSGIPYREKQIYFAVIITNYLGCIIIGMSLSDYYFLLEGIKTMIGGLILYIFMIRAYLFIKKIQSTLMSAIGGSSQATSVTKNMRSETTKRGIQTLRKKFFMFSAVTFMAATVQIANSFIVWGLVNDEGVPVDFHWKYLIEEQIDPAQFAIKILFLLTFMTLAYFFTVPTSDVVAKSDKSAIVSSSNEGTSMTRIFGRQHGDGVAGVTVVTAREVNQPASGHDFSYSMPEGAERRPSFTISTTNENGEMGAESRQSDFKSMLQNNDRRKEFAKFVSGRYASESIKFYEAASRYETITNIGERKKFGKEIIKNHFIENAPYPITVKDSLRKKILEESEFGPNAFKAALQETVELLNNNFYHTFSTVESKTINSNKQ